jgi:hypothetical protein
VNQSALKASEKQTVIVALKDELSKAALLSAISQLKQIGLNDKTIDTLSAVDPDSGETFVFSLVSGSGHTDNSAFSIVGSNLRLN